MGLLSEIQESLLTEGSSLGTTLLKLRFLASRIGSDVLEDWVRHEIDGYPKDVDVPSYRQTGIIFFGTFTDGYQTLNNTPVPLALIAEHAGNHWLTHELRDGMGVIDSIISRSEKNAQFSVDAANLLLIIQHKLYKNMTCVTINGIFDVRAFVKVQSVVRAKILDLTIKLEKDVPESKGITMNEKVDALPPSAAAAANSATQSIVYNVTGPFTQITNSGQVGGITVNVAQGNIESLISELVANGIPENDAKELADIMKDEQPESAQQPFGKRALKWVGEKLGGAAWGIGKAAASALLTEAAKKFYGLLV